MTKLHTQIVSSNPHAARLLALLSLIADLIDLRAVPTAQGALMVAWRLHAAWPLDLDSNRRSSALGAIVRAEQALAALRRRGSAPPAAPAAASVVFVEAA